MSDVTKCPHCEKYIDNTFTLDACPKCRASLKGIALPNDRLDQSENMIKAPLFLIPGIVVILVIMHFLNLESDVNLVIYGIIAMAFVVALQAVEKPRMGSDEDEDE